MWKPWVKVTESERDEISRIANEFEIPMQEVSNMFQSGMSFTEIITKLSRE